MGLRYGAAARQSWQLGCSGRDVLFNGSRAALAPARGVFPDLAVIRITAPSPVLMERLLARGRETRAEIEARMQRQSYEVPPGLQRDRCSQRWTARCGDCSISGSAGRCCARI